jgi:MFS family permease
MSTRQHPLHSDTGWAGQRVFDAVTRSASQRRRIGATIALLVLLTTESVVSAFTYPFFSLALDKQDLPSWLIGFNASLAGAGILIVGPFLPRLISTFGLSRLVAGLFGLSSLCFVAILTIDDVAVWFATRFVMGACFAALWATTEIWLNGVVDDRRRGRVMALAMVLYTGAQATGPLLVSATGTSGKLPLIAAMVPLAIGAILALCIRGDGPTEEAARPSTPGRFGLVQAFGAIRALIVVSFVIGLVSTAILSLLPVFALEEGLSDETASQLVAIFGLGELVLVIALGILADRFQRRHLLRLYAVPTLAIAVMLPLVASNVPLLAVVLFLAGGCLGGIYTLGLILLGQDFRGQKLAVVSTGFVMAYSAGSMTGSTPIGFLIDVFGSDAFIVSVSLSLVVVTACVWRGSPTPRGESFESAGPERPHIVNEPARSSRRKTAVQIN